MRSIDIQPTFPLVASSAFVVILLVAGVPSAAAQGDGPGQTQSAAGSSIWGIDTGDRPDAGTGDAHSGDVNYGDVNSGDAADRDELSLVPAKSSGGCSSPGTSSPLGSGHLSAVVVGFLVVGIRRRLRR